jgi:Tfp pilus assembly protein PilN
MLEAERRNLAKLQQRDSIIAAFITQAGLIVLVALPLAVCVYLLYVLKQSAPQDDDLVELLVEELAAQQPQLQTGNSSPPALPHPEVAEQQSVDQ